MGKQAENIASAKYTLETRVRYSECGADGRAGLSSILNYLQDACTFQAEDLAVGAGYMQAHQSAWVLNSWQADIARYPALGEKIAVTTWPYGFHGFYGFRNFTVEDGTGEMLVRANSVWVFMDLLKGRPAKIAPEAIAAYQVGGKLDMEYMDRKIPEFEAGTAGEAIRVPRHFIDTNYHVNNAKYILLAEELFPPDFKAVRFRAEYRRSAVFGELLYPSMMQQPGLFSVRLNGADGKPYAVMEFYSKMQETTE